jgi:hypothetical protein
MCDAAAAKLNESHTRQIVLIIIVDTHGRVESFSTAAPKGLKLEKDKKAAAEIEAMHFEPALKDGKPVTVMIQATFDCPIPTTPPKSD